MTSVQHDFQVWIRPDGHDGDRFQLKYRVGTGKALFRIQQRTGITSTPASNADVVSALTPKQVAGSQLLVSNNGRHTFGFAENTIQRVNGLKANDWVPLGVTAANQLEVPAHNDQATEPPDNASASHTVGPTAMDAARVRHLEAALIRTKKHVQELKNRVAQLEEQVTDLGGNVRPLILR